MELTKQLFVDLPVVWISYFFLVILTILNNSPYWISELSWPSAVFQIQVSLDRYRNFMPNAHFAKRLSILVTIQICFGKILQHYESHLSFKNFLQNFKYVSLKISYIQINEEKYIYIDNVFRFHSATHSLGSGFWHQSEKIYGPRYLSIVFSKNVAPIVAKPLWPKM